MFDINKEMPDLSRYGHLQGQPSEVNFQLDTHHRFILKRLPNMTFYCQSVNLPGAGIDVINQPVPMFNTIKRPGGEIMHDDVMVQFLVDDGMSNWREIFQWIKECSNYTDHTEYKSPQEHLCDEAQLFILNSSHKATFRIDFYNLFPNSIDGIQFDTKSHSNQIYCNAAFSFSHYEIVDIT